MPEKCTCGAILVDDARFCHRCGRPTALAPANLTADEPVAPRVPVVDAAQQTPQAVLARAGQLPIGFTNPVALRVAILMAMMILLVAMIPGLNVLFLLWWLGAGWGSVVLYRRLTGLSLAVRPAAKLGSLTGVLTFIGMTLISALAMTFTGTQVLETMVKQNPEMKQVVNDPTMLAAVFLMVLVLFFFLVVGACAAGAALAAKSMASRRQA